MDDNWNNDLYFDRKKYFESWLESLPKPADDARQEEKDAFYNAVQDFYWSL